MEILYFLAHLASHCPLHHVLEIYSQRLSMLLNTVFFHFYMLWEYWCGKKLKSIPNSILIYVFKLIFTKFSQPAFKFYNIHKIKHLHFVQIFSKNSLLIKLLKHYFYYLQFFGLSGVKLCNLMLFMDKFPHINICIDYLSFPIPKILPFAHFLQSYSPLDHIYFLLENFNIFELTSFFIIIITQVNVLYFWDFGLQLFIRFYVVNRACVRDPLS